MVVLATKVYVEGDARERALRSLDALVSNRIGELAVDFEIGVRHDEFPSVTVSGEDAPVARRALAEEWGTITPDHAADEVYVGTLEGWDEDGFRLDAGRTVRVGPEGLELGGGSPTRLVDRFGLVQHQCLEFVAGQDPALADVARDRLFDWQRGGGRVNVNSVTRAEARAAVNRAGHAEDIVTVERLGLLEQSVICAPGTDPPGLVADLGPHLPGEMRAVMP